MGENVICTLGLIHVRCYSLGSATSTLQGLEQVMLSLDALACPWGGDEVFYGQICAVGIEPAWRSGARGFTYQRTELSPVTRLQSQRKAEVNPGT